jgi:hypothetical protein
VLEVIWVLEVIQRYACGGGGGGGTSGWTSHIEGEKTYKPDDVGSDLSHSYLSVTFEFQTSSKGELNLYECKIDYGSRT